jgi:glycosyltransferase involved in cell wall biosynthesis
MTRVASVVVPARNEADRIGTTLRALLGGVVPVDLEVVVVCNGCTDRTAAVAREVAGVQVYEIKQPSKVAALREGDARASVFPRLYLDADVELSRPTAVALARALDVDGPRVAGVLAELDTSDSTRLVRWFFAFRQRLPVFQEGIIGAGVYAMNAAGRARFGVWPEVLGDDQFVLRLFEPHERVTLSDHRSRVKAPPDLRTVIRRGVRVRRGNVELSRGVDGTRLVAPKAGVLSALRWCLLRPRTWPEALTWLAVSVWIRVLARVRVGGGDWAVAGPEHTTPPEPT